MLQVCILLAHGVVVAGSMRAAALYNVQSCDIPLPAGATSCTAPVRLNDRLIRCQNSRTCSHSAVIGSEQVPGVAALAHVAQQHGIAAYGHTARTLRSSSSSSSSTSCFKPQPPLHDSETAWLAQQTRLLVPRTCATHLKPPCHQRSAEPSVPRCRPCAPDAAT